MCDNEKCISKKKSIKKNTVKELLPDYKGRVIIKKTRYRIIIINGTYENTDTVSFFEEGNYQLPCRVILCERCYFLNELLEKCCWCNLEMLDSGVKLDDEKIMCKFCITVLLSSKTMFELEKECTGWNSNNNYIKRLDFSTLKSNNKYSDSRGCQTERNVFCDRNMNSHEQLPASRSINHGRRLKWINGRIN